MKYLTPIIRFIISLARPTPARDWYLVLGIVAMLGAGIVGVALYFYIGLQLGAIITPQPLVHASPPSVSRTELSRVVAEFQQRVVNYNAQ